MDQDLLTKAYKAHNKNQGYAFATVIEATLKGTPRKSGAKMIVLEDGHSYGTIGGGRNEKDATKRCLEAIKTNKSSILTYDYFGQKGQSVCGGQIKVFIEPFAKKKDFVICGAGHIALPLSQLGKMLNYNVTIIDDRSEFTKNSRFPHVDKIIKGTHAKALSKLKIDSKSYIMIVTQGNEYDFECLRVALKTKAGYIGVISSQAKRIKFFKRLKALKFSEKNLKRIMIPAGIDIGAQTPEEIAISIASELITQTNKDYIGTTKFKKRRA